MSAPSITPEVAKKQLAKTNKFGSKMAWKIKKNNELAAAIDEHFLDSYDIVLPATREQFREIRHREFSYNPNGPSLDQQQLQHDQRRFFYEEYAELINLRYALKETRGYFAEFGNEKGAKKLVPLTFWYSRNRLDYAWNMRKSQIIRSRYYEFLKTAIDGYGRLLYQHYLPMHLTLTLPHQNGLFKGKRFYARELITRFAELRKMFGWKDMIYAGEYGVEIKKSKDHGLHIHMHCFLLQNPVFEVNAVRERLVKEWKELTDNTSNYSGLHYETLFTWAKNPDGTVKTEPKFEKNEEGRLVHVKGEQVPVKKYIVPGESSLEEYLAGVMECIKYHFKPDCLEKEEGQFDIQLIKEILDNTKGKRLYSRFGGFYRQPLLNFNRLEKEDLTEEETEEEVIASSEGVEERLINPFTLQRASREEYEIKVGRPELLRYRKKDDPNPYEPYYFNSANILRETPLGMALKDIIRMQATRKSTYF